MNRIILIIVGLMMVNIPMAMAKVNVVTTFSILGDIVSHVAGEGVNLTVLVGPDSDAHTFEPTPKDSVALAGADLVFENGLHFEHWMDDLYKASGSKAKRIVVTEGIEPLMINEDGVFESDPHVWHNVEHVMLMVDRIREALIEQDPAHSEDYAKNAAAYLEQLGELNLWIVDTLKEIPIEERKIVTSHDALGYFAQQYNLKVMTTVIPSATTEAQDPSAKQTAEVLATIKSAGVKALFTENMHSKKFVELLAKEAGVVVAPELYTDALGSKGSDGETYIQMMKHNAKVFALYLR